MAWTKFYTYDDMNRLATADRGDLNANKDAITGTPAWEEDWSLDMTGNWTDYVQKTSGNTDLDQDRTHNDVNELTNTTETTGTAWITPVQDRNGNMTTVPKPASLSSGLTLKYDAWNRLVEVKDGATVIGLYEYDAKNQRVKRHLDTDSPADPNGLDTYVHYFYNTQWQTLETRQTTTESDQPESLQPKYQYIWSPRYIDAPVLRDENTDQDSLCDDQRLYYLTDANFNITTLVDSSGDAQERYIYDSYGKLTIYDATWSSTRSTSTYDNAVTYTGRESDFESGIMHYRNRYYSTELGRFVSRDPIGYKGSKWNVYEYVGSKPLVSVDSKGLKKVCKINLFAMHDFEAERLLERFDWEKVPQCNFLGIVSCRNTILNDKIPENHRIVPAIPGTDETIWWENAHNHIEAALRRAQTMAGQLCGRARYNGCCCDEVRINVKCTEDVKTHIKDEEGLYTQPGDRRRLLCSLSNGLPEGTSEEVRRDYKTVYHCDR